MSPISYSPASPSEAMMNNNHDVNIQHQHHHTMETSSSSPMQQQQQPITMPGSSSSPSSSSASITASFSSHQQQQQEQQQQPTSSSNVNASPLQSHHTKVTVATPKVKVQQPEDCLLAASLDRRTRERGIPNNNTWSHPREAYFREIGSSRMVSAEANAMAGLPYQSPSNAMMDALRHSTQHPSSSGSSLNPVATHHRIPSIHSARLPSLRQHPFTRHERPGR